MRTYFYLIDYNTNRSKKITKKQALTYINKNELKEALYCYMQDPNESIEYMTRDGRLHIEFVF